MYVTPHGISNFTGNACYTLASFQLLMQCTEITQKIIDLYNKGNSNNKEKLRYLAAFINWYNTTTSTDGYLYIKDLMNLFLDKIYPNTNTEKYKGKIEFWGQKVHLQFKKQEDSNEFLTNLMGVYLDYFPDILKLYQIKIVDELLFFKSDKLANNNTTNKNFFTYSHNEYGIKKKLSKKILKRSIKPDYEGILNLSIPNSGNATFSNVFDSYFKIEFRENEDPFPTNRKIYYSTQKKIIDTSKYFFISFVRFISDYNENNNLITSKINIDIEQIPVDNFQINNKIYNLVGFINHLGKLMVHGHYIAHRKYKEIWYKCDDSSVGQIEGIMTSDNIYLKKSYILLYEEQTGRNSNIPMPISARRNNFTTIQLLIERLDFFYKNEISKKSKIDINLLFNLLYYKQILECLIKKGLLNFGQHINISSGNASLYLGIIKRILYKK